MTHLIYCPVCGHTLGQREEGGRMRQACDNCGYVNPKLALQVEQDQA